MSDFNLALSLSLDGKPLGTVLAAYCRDDENCNQEFRLATSAGIIGGTLNVRAVTPDPHEVQR